MAKTITVDAQTIEHIVKQLDTLTKEMRELKKKLAEKPVYGSVEWWQQQQLLADADIESGRMTTISNERELQEFFDKL